MKWVYDFSWTEVQSTKVETREFLLAQSKLDLNALVDFTDNEIKTKWVARNFHEFDILTIDPSITSIIWIFMLTILINVGAGWWIVANEFADFEIGTSRDVKYWINKYFRR